ncbi:MAG: type III CRISPR-associated RAMP protein Csx7 [Candidatus Freyarchaeota archaeon]|nr:CRISPR-associated RAMP protein [Candidatus Bathyarchaeota archaeon]
MLGFHVNARTVSFKGALIAQSPLRVGAGQGQSGFSPIDLSCIRIVKDGREIPYIPGSSLKGVIRSAVEQIIRTAGIKGVDACYPYAASSCFRKYNKMLEEYQRRMRSEVDTEKVIREMLTFVEQNYCLACRMFGATGIAGHVVVRDCYGDKYSFGVRTGIAIDRRTGSVARGALYEVEFVNPGSRFSFEVLMRNMPNYQVGLVAAAILEVNNGRVLIGGMKSRGFGRAKIVVGEVSVDHSPMAGRLEGLIEGDPPVTIPEKGGMDDEEYTLKVLEAFKEAWVKFAADR